eukprot:scaffold27542_cov33-Attheya_sp.AAC.3
MLVDPVLSDATPDLDDEEDKKLPSNKSSKALMLGNPTLSDTMSDLEDTKLPSNKSSKVSVLVDPAISDIESDDEDELVQKSSPKKSMISILHAPLLKMVLSALNDQVKNPMPGCKGYLTLNGLLPLLLSTSLLR